MMTDIRLNLFALIIKNLYYLKFSTFYYKKLIFFLQNKPQNCIDDNIILVQELILSILWLTLKLI